METSNAQCSSSLMSSNIVVVVVRNYDNYLNFHYEIKSSRSTREKDIQLCCRNSSKCRTDLLLCLLSSFSLHCHFCSMAFGDSNEKLKFLKTLLFMYTKFIFY